MGWVEIVETLKVVSSIPVPKGVILLFMTGVNGLTYDNIYMRFDGINKTGEETQYDITVGSVPTKDHVKGIIERLDHVFGY